VDGPVSERATAGAKSDRDQDPRQDPRLRWLVNESGEFDDLPPLASLEPDQVFPLGGGVDATTYVVKCPDRDVVVKFNTEGLQAEAEALRAWRPYTSRVPEVLGIGSVPDSDEPDMRYLIVRALKNDDGDIVETALDYLERSPDTAREIGRAVGAELGLMHQAVAGTRFGNFADTAGAERSYDSWGGYLTDFFEVYAHFVAGMGVGEGRIRQVRSFLRSCAAVDEARFLHGDVTIRNVGVYSYRPISVGLFDPNPLCGDPSWDVAPMMNNAAFNELRYRTEGVEPEALQRDRELLAGFREIYPNELAAEALLAAQLMQAVLQAEHRKAELEDGKTDPLDAEVTEQFIRTAVDRMAT
jgi:fructosamine-3-kinase